MNSPSLPLESAPNENVPLVSVCIPCYNNAPFVGEAIESALAQTHRNVEVIVVDDGSTDASVEVLRSFGSSIRFEAGPNRGANTARNRAFELSRGQYIQFLDADDRLVPTKFEIQLPHLEREEADLVFCRGFLFGDGQKLRPKRAPIASPVGVDPFVYCLKQGLSTEGPLHRRTQVERVGGFRTGVRRAQELDFHLRLAATGARIHLVDEWLYEHRHHDGPRITRTAQAPDHMVLLLLELSEILENAPYELSASRRAALAGVLFQHAIWAYRNSAPRSAERHNAERHNAERGFARARCLARRFDYEERRAYKLLAGALGPVGAERTLESARQLRAKTRQLADNKARESAASREAGAKVSGEGASP